MDQDAARGKPAVARALVVVLALTVLGALLRLRAVDSALPQRNATDEAHMLDELDLLRVDPATARADPRYYVYPLLVPRLAWLLQPSEVPPAPRSLEAHLELASGDLRRCRWISALLALIAVPCTWFVARRFLDERTSLFATALMATSPLHVWYSALALPHTSASGLMVLAILGAFAIRQRGDLASYLFAGAAAGLAAGASQASAVVLPSILLAHLLRRKANSASGLVGLLGAGAAFLAVAWTLCPAWFGDRRSLMPLPINGSYLFTGAGLGRVLIGLWHYDPLPIALAVAGAIALPVLWFSRRSRPREARPAEPVPERSWFLRRWLSGREDLAIVLVHVVPAAAVIALYDSSAQRYFLPLLPYTLCITAWVLMRASTWFAGRLAPGRWTMVLALAPPLALVAFETGLTLRTIAVSVAPDTAARAADWITAHCDPQRSRIALAPGIDLPLLRAPELIAIYGAGGYTPLARYQAHLGESERGAATWQLFSMPLQSKGTEWQLVHENPAAYLESIDAEYVVLQLDPRTIAKTLNDQLRSVCTLEARFSPMRVDLGDDTPLLWWETQNEYSEGFSRLWRMLHAQSIGGVVEIHRFDGRTDRK